MHSALDALTWQGRNSWIPRTRPGVCWGHPGAARKQNHSAHMGLGFIVRRPFYRMNPLFPQQSWRLVGSCGPILQMKHSQLREGKGNCPLRQKTPRARPLSSKAEIFPFHGQRLPALTCRAHWGQMSTGGEAMGSLGTRLSPDQG